MQRRRRRMAERACTVAAALRRITGIKRPICRPMIARDSIPRWRDCLLASRSRHAQLPIGKLRYDRQSAARAGIGSASRRSRAGRPRRGVLEARPPADAATAVADHGSLTNTRAGVRRRPVAVR